MKTFVRWGVQYILAAASMFALLVFADTRKGTLFSDAWRSALLWAVLSSAIFVGARYWQAKRQERCVICETFGQK